MSTRRAKTVARRFLTFESEKSDDGVVRRLLYYSASTDNLTLRRKSRLKKSGIEKNMNVNKFAAYIFIFTNFSQ